MARAPALARLLSHNAHLALVKRQKTWISLGAQISVREVALSRAERYLADASAEGTAYLRLEVQAGEAAREASWRVEDAVAVEVGVWFWRQVEANADAVLGFFLIAYITAGHLAAGAPPGFPGVPTRRPAEDHDGPVRLPPKRSAGPRRRPVPSTGAKRRPAIFTAVALSGGDPCFPHAVTTSSFSLSSVVIPAGAHSVSDWSFLLL